MIFEWGDTPGIFYSIAYILGCSVIIQNCPRKFDRAKTVLITIACGVLLSVFMTVTHGAYSYIFAFLMVLYVLMICVLLKVVCKFDMCTSFYFTIRAFMMGEFMASFSFQMYYYSVMYKMLPFTWGASFGFILFVDLILATIFYGLEHKLRKMNGSLTITGKELLSVFLIAFAVYVTSNLSYILETMSISPIVVGELFLVRTLVDLGGVAILFAYHSQLLELNSRYEVMQLQSMLEMQYNNYEILKQSVEVVNQKYHDLKYQIALLREEFGQEKGNACLDKIESDIKAYEANNKTGNNALDTILTAKTLYCQNNWIELTSVADGEALNFMEPMDIAVLFGNILDNAIESVSKIERKERRLIHLAVARQKGFLRIRVENCCDEEPICDGENIVTSKNDKRYHGFGIKSIKNTVKKYGGNTDIEVSKGWFEIRILIPIP
jgi:hypothetical protein